MTDLEQFIVRARTYCETRAVSPSTLSRKLLGNGNRLGELEAGKSLRLDTFARAKRLLSEMERTPAPAPAEQAHAA